MPYPPLQKRYTTGSDSRKYTITLPPLFPYSGCCYYTQPKKSKNTISRTRFIESHRIRWNIRKYYRFYPYDVFLCIDMVCSNTKALEEREVNSLQYNVNILISNIGLPRTYLLEFPSGTEHLRGLLPCFESSAIRQLLNLCTEASASIVYYYFIYVKTYHYHIHSYSLFQAIKYSFNFSWYLLR